MYCSLVHPPRDLGVVLISKYFTFSLAKSSIISLVIRAITVKSVTTLCMSENVLKALVISNINGEIPGEGVCLR